MESQNKIRNATKAQRIKDTQSDKYLLSNFLVKLGVLESLWQNNLFRVGTINNILTLLLWKAINTF